MTNMAREMVYFVLTFVSGFLLVAAVGNAVAVRLNQQRMTSLADFLPLWTVIISGPLFNFAYGGYDYYRKMRAANCQPAPRFPHRDPIFGLDWLFWMVKLIKVNQVCEEWDKLYKTLGKTFYVKNIGQWVVMTSDPENIKTIMSVKASDWPYGWIRRNLLGQAIGHKGIFSVDGPEWAHARAMIRPTFVRNQIADLECTDRHAKHLLAKIPRDGRAFDLQELLYMFTMDVSTDFMFGHSTNTLVNPSKEAVEFTDAFEHALFAVSNRSRMGSLTLMLPDKKVDKSRATCQRFIDRYVAAAMDDKTKRERPYVFMNEMINSGASQIYVRDQLLAMLLGGRDTSASAMSALFWTLARRPDVVEKIRVEVDTLNGGTPTWEELKNLTYLNNVLKEALRLWPPVVAMGRAAARDTVLPRGGGPDGLSPVFIPKNTFIRMVLTSTHRLQDVYGEDADEFRPERWDSDLRPGWAYIPFSGGPRVCIGQQFALTQMLFLIVRIFQNFEEFAPKDDRPMRHVLRATASLQNGCWISVKPKE